MIQALINHKLVRYIFIGGSATLIHISMAYLFIYYVNNNIFASNIFAFSIAYLFSYTLQSKLVFGHELHIKKAIKYFLVQFASLLVAIALSNSLHALNSYFKTIVVAMLLPLVTFLIHKFWTFKENTEKKETYNVTH